MNKEIYYHVDCSAMPIEDCDKIRDWFNENCAVVIDFNEKTHCFILIWSLDVLPTDLTSFPKPCVVRRISKKEIINLLHPGNHHT